LVRIVDLDTWLAKPVASFLQTPFEASSRVPIGAARVSAAAAFE
jgi:hypothetical protein